LIDSLIDTVKDSSIKCHSSTNDSVKRLQFIALRQLCSTVPYSATGTNSCVSVAGCCSAVVLSRLDYCNSMLDRLPVNFIQRLQSVQNAVAQLILWDSSVWSHYRCAYQPPLATSAYTGQIISKIAVLTYGAVNSRAPSYLSTSPVWLMYLHTVVDRGSGRRPQPS